ncbi:hypothetical protein BR93DRAFT_925308 [Coniochaeta sp. PMI_546]|nr:hypothetical protein BR93DRAFT_925308 [Coniochaeta sp. PMI_546]
MSRLMSCVILGQVFCTLDKYLDAALCWRKRLGLQEAIHTLSEICDGYSLQPLPDAKTVQFMQVDLFGSCMTIWKCRV